MIDTNHLIRRAVAGSFLLLLLPAMAHGQPSARTSARMVHDPVLGRPVLFGGLTPAHTLGDSRSVRGYIDETWLWTGRRWVQRFHDVKPPARASFAMVWDSNRQRVLLFGGAGPGTTFFNDTWQLRDETWSRIDTPNAPEPRRFPGYAFDPLIDRLILYGGSDATTNFRDTWEFDGTTWTRTGEGGPDVVNPMLVRDETRNEVLLLGMTDSGEVAMFRYTNPGWEPIDPETMPTCVNFAHMVHQDHNGKVLLVGGACPDGNAPGETWEWDGTEWALVTTSGSPGFLLGQAMAYDATRQETVLFGGSDVFGFDLSQTSRYKNGAWTLAATAFTPGPRSLFVFESDPNTGAVWLFGGVNSAGDLWKLQYGRWERVVAAGAPAVCLNPGGTWDSDRNRLVVVCDDGNVHEWDGQAWTSFTTLTENPPFRRWSGIAYDPTLRRTVLYGGFDGFNYLNETWTWNGATWTRVEGDDAFRRSLPIMFYDPNLRRVVLYGGVGRRSREGIFVRFGDTWSFDGRDWGEVTNANSPPPRYGSLVSLDPTTGLTHVFGGKNEVEQFTNEHFVWNGTSWASVIDVRPPSPRQTGGLAWDPVTGEMILYGGYAGYYLGDLWRLTPAGWLPEQERGRKIRPVVVPPAIFGSPSAAQPQREETGDEAW
ncbi:MAG TPA: kelch repeat-containing protein [Thermoanaerobaculia bacterium]|nr:kelch repeat-containing protein [Thermoanaerobaculia bacterium]